MLIITNVEKNTFADEIGLKPGDALLSINEQKIRDGLDYQFYAAEEDVELTFQKGDEP